MRDDIKNIVKVLIVEDEILVRIGLKMSVDWERHGYQIVGEASDGIEALRLCESLKPDIVLTDIKMPKMNGLEFIKQLNDKYPDIKAVILSNYDEFSYAQEALNLGTVNYVLKVDVNPDELIEILNNIREKYIKNIKITGSVNMVKDNSLEKYNLIKSLISGNIMDCEIEGCIKKHKLQLANKNLILATVKIDNCSSEGEDNFYRNNLQNEEYFSKLFKQTIAMSPKEYRENVLRQK